MKTTHFLRQKRHKSLRHKVIGTAHRPRLSVYRGLKHLYVQIIDDSAQKTLIGITDKSVIGQGSGVVRAEALAKEVAKQAHDKKITSLVFDRGGFRYHGQIKAFAEALRSEGITI